MDGRCRACRIGARCVYVHSYYAPAKQKSDPFRKSQAQRLLGLLFGVAATSGDAPTIISADLNENPEKCEILKKAIASGKWIDIGKAVAGEHEAPSHIPQARSLPRHHLSR